MLHWRIHILSFSCSFRQKISKIIPIWELGHTPRDNPGSASESLDSHHNHVQCVFDDKFQMLLMCLFCEIVIVAIFMCIWLLFRRQLSVCDVLPNQCFAGLETRAMARWAAQNFPLSLLSSVFSSSRNSILQWRIVQWKTSDENLIENSIEKSLMNKFIFNVLYPNVDKLNFHIWKYLKVDLFS